MSTTKQVEASASGFTPCPDVLVAKYSHTTATIWGKIWRYCQMKDGVCNAAIQRLANELNLSDVTVEKHIKLLEEGKYIKDMTPDLRNKPHTYVDTGKLKLKISIFMEEDTTKNLGSHYQKTSVEESSSNIFSIYENNIGMLTPMQADILKDAEKTYPLQWIVDAIKLAVENNKRSWRYCETILRRWTEEGKDEGKRAPEPKEQPAHIPDMGDLEARYGI